MNSGDKHQSCWPVVLTSLVMVCTLMSGLGFASVRRAFAQLESGDWSPPVNLSQSGATSNPEIVVDETGAVHVVWLDEFSGMMYSNLVDGEWSPPQVFVAPSIDIIPQFVADNNGYIHAFWITEDLDLLHNRIAISNFGNNNAWVNTTLLDQGVIKFNIEIGFENRLHVAYLRNVDEGGRQAGIYYVNTLTGGASWNRPDLLYSSSYTRTLAPDKANIQITSSLVDGIEQLFVSWDESPRKRIYFSRSSDGGATWVTPLEIDKPNTSNPMAKPQNILVASNGEEVLLFWEDGNRDEFSCRFYYQSSQDSGESWSNRSEIEIGLLGCLDDSKTILLDGGNVLLIGKIQNQITLLIWDGESWSEPQVQESFSRFTNQDTLTPITLSCIKISHANSILYLVGCDLGSSGDIWMSTYSLEGTERWFDSQLDWKKPVLIQQSPAGISYPSVSVDVMSEVHVLWSELEVKADNSTISRLGYAVNNGPGWSQPILVSRSIEGDVAQIDSIVDADGNILVTWSGGDFGDIYFAEADSQRAGNLSEWSQPKLISPEKSIGSSPVIQVDQERVVYIVYGISLNEGRGVYLSIYDRETRELEAPSLVYDASLDGYELVSDISFARDTRGHLYVAWMQKPIEPDVVAGGDLYFVSSLDNGLTWSNVEKLGYDNVVWSRIVVQDDQTVHLFYQEVARVGYYGLKHMYSIDYGVSWSSPADILSHIGESPGLVIPLVDKDAGLLLVRSYTEKRSNKLIVQQLRWVDQKWVFESGASFPVYNNEEIIGIDGWAAGDKIVLVYAVKEQQYITAPANYFLYYTERSLEASVTISGSTPEISPIVQSPEATPKPATTQSTEASSSQNETPTPVPSSDLAEVLNPRQTPTASPQQAGSRLPGILGDYGVGLGIGGIAAAIIGIAFWMRRRNLGQRK